MAVGLARTPDRHEWLKPGAWGCQTKRLATQSAEGETPTPLLVFVTLINVERNEQCPVLPLNSGTVRVHQPGPRIPFAKNFVTTLARIRSPCLDVLLLNGV